MIKKKDKFQMNYLNKEYTRTIYEKEWNYIITKITKEKIINYYEDN